MARFATWLLAVVPMLLLSAPAWAGGPNPTSVPEPVSMTLLATGVAGVALAKFRRK